MDWYAWLRRAGLGADLAYEYALLFARNELGAADVRHLDHGVLATMGVAVAKHRLEILKLARKESASSPSSSVAAAITVLPWRATRLLAAASHRSARSLLAGCLFQHSATRRDRAAVAPRPLLCHHYRGGGPAGAGRKTASTVACKRGRARKQLAFLAHVSKPILRLTNGGGKEKNDGATTHRATVAAGCFASSHYEGTDEEEDMDGGEEMRWESMFEDLNPT